MSQTAIILLFASVLSSAVFALLMLGLEATKDYWFAEDSFGKATTEKTAAEPEPSR